MNRRALPCLLLLAACAHAPAQPPAFCSAAEHQSQEASLGVAGALATLNHTFLEAHASARAQRCAFLEHDGLVLRYAGGHLEARLHGRVLLAQTNVLPVEYHPLKDVAHSLFLAALIATDTDRAHRAASLPAARDAIDGVLHELDDAHSKARALIAPAHVERQRAILTHARAALLAPDLETARRELSAAHADLQTNLTVVATETLRGLHAAVQRVRASVNASEPAAWDSLLVVVAVAHQARAQALEVQYFERLLREPMKEGAHGERRIVVAENVELAADQYGLLAMHLVDQTGGRLLFEDRTRLQRDVLSGHDEVLDRLLPPAPAPAP